MSMMDAPGMVPIGPSACQRCQAQIKSLRYCGSKGLLMSAVFRNASSNLTSIFGRQAIGRYPDFARQRHQLN